MKYKLIIFANDYSFTRKCLTAVEALDALANANGAFDLCIDLDEALCIIAEVARGKMISLTKVKWAIFAEKEQEGEQ